MKVNQGEGADDLAIGIPRFDLGANDTGMVLILQGSSVVIFENGFESGNTSAWSDATP